MKTSLKRILQRTAVAAALTLSSVVSAAAADLIPVNVGFYPGATFQTLIFVSDVKGFYKEAGLNPTFIATQNGPLMNSELASGAIDLGYNAPSQVGLAREQGLDLAFAAGNARMPWVLIARTDLKLPHKGQYPGVIADLKGMSWGVYGRGSDGEVFMRVMAQDAHLDLDKDVTWIGVGGPATGLPALKVNKIQAYLTLDPAPFIAAAEGYGQTILDLRKGEGPANLKGVIYQGIETRQKTLAEKPEIFIRTIEAHKKAYCWVRNPKNFDELVAILKTKLPAGGLSDDQFRQMVRENIPTLTLTFPEPQLQQWNDLLVGAKVLKAPLRAEDILWKEMPKEDPKC